MLSDLPKTSRDTTQLSLFQRTWQEMGQKFGIERHQAVVLFRYSLLSFDPSTVEEITDAQFDELTFTKRLIFDSGLSHEVALAMLNQLEKPYQYSFEQIYWDFGIGKWRSFAWVIDHFRQHNELWFLADIESELERADWPTIQWLEEKLRGERLCRDQLHARECFDDFDVTGFAAIERLLKTIVKSPSLTSDQRANIQNGIQLFRLFPSRWPTESFYLRAATGDDPTLELSVNEDALSIEIWHGSRWVFEYNFSREHCSGSINPDVFAFVQYVENEVSETIYEKFEV